MGSKSMAAPLRVQPRPQAGTQQKDFTGVCLLLSRAAGAGMGCSIVSAMHHEWLGTTMGSRHSSGADLLLSHHGLTSELPFACLSHLATRWPQAPPLLSAVDGLERSRGTSQYSRTVVVAVGDHEQQQE